METTLEESGSKPKMAPKRIKFEEILEEGKEDRISTLPECLILEILSRLPSTKEAIRTGKLSKRWEHLWTLLPTLIFNRYNENPPWSDFISFIDKTLIQCRQLKLKKFQVDTCSYDIGFESQVNNWVSYAIRCNVEELNLSLWNARSPPGVPVDQILFNSSCFTDLRLSGFILNPTAAISWKNLRSLSISYGKLDEDLIAKILLGSPLLETLELHYCYDYQMLNITSKSLKKLVIQGYKDPEDEIDTGFESQVNNWIRFAIRCNVEELHLMLWHEQCIAEHQFDQILFISSCFTDLILDGYGYILKPTGAISWKNLRSLSISYAELDEDLIKNILCGSPQLETLVLVRCYGYRRLDITSKSLKNLVFCGYRDFSDAPDDDDSIIEINAPYILSLTIADFLFVWKVVLLNVCSLVEANLYYEKCGHYETTYEEAEEEMLKGFILNLCHVKELKIGGKCSGVMSHLEAKGSVFPSNIKFPTNPRYVIR